MNYLLDSNAVIALLNKSSDALVRKLRQRDPGMVATSVIVMQELFYGAFESGRVERNLAALEQLHLPLLEFEWSDAREAGEIRAHLHKRGTPIGPFDALIAGQARARGLIVVTNNVREFSRVPGLGVEDWLVD
jgi:tRNA(fMet)-specific endonuclease VapC